MYGSLYALRKSSFKKNLWKPYVVALPDFPPKHYRSYADKVSSADYRWIFAVSKSAMRLRDSNPLDLLLLLRTICPQYCVTPTLCWVSGE